MVLRPKYAFGLNFIFIFERYLYAASSQGVLTCILYTLSRDNVNILNHSEVTTQIVQFTQINTNNLKSKI